MADPTQSDQSASSPADLLNEDFSPELIQRTPQISGLSHTDLLRPTDTLPSENELNHAAILTEPVPNHMVPGSNDDILDELSEEDWSPNDPSVCSVALVEEFAEILGEFDFEGYDPLGPVYPTGDDLTSPWGQPSGSAIVNIPSEFPDQITDLLRRMPLLEDPIGQNVQQVIVDFIIATWPHDSAQGMTRLRQIAAVLSLAPPHVLDDIAHTISALVARCYEHERGLQWPLSLLISQEWHISGNNFYPWLIDLEDSRLFKALGLPMTARNLLHLLEHVVVNSRPSDNVNFSISITSCREGLYTPKNSAAAVTRFIESLPIISNENIAKDDRCGICCTPYGNAGLWDEDWEPEKARKLLCSHLLGENCLRMLLNPKDQGGWEQTTCPLCRADILVPMDDPFQRWLIETIGL